MLDVTNILDSKCDQKSETHFSGYLLPLYFKKKTLNQWSPGGPNWKISASVLPKSIIIDFGTNYRGLTFILGYPNISGWVPIHPISDQWYTKLTKVGGSCEEHTQNILSLRFCWAWKVWNGQGQTIQGKVILHLGRGEKECCWSYVTMFCVTHFSGIGLYEGIMYNRLCKLIQKHKIMTPHVNSEQCVRTLFTRIK